MKQLIAAGFPRVFQFSRSFRQEESGRLHNPEFAILEWYRSGDSLRDLVVDLEGLLGHVARALGISGELRVGDRRVNLFGAFDVVTVQEAFGRYAGWDPLAGTVDPDRFDLDLVQRVEPNLGRDRPTVLTEYPVSLGALAAVHPHDPRVALRAELYVLGIELANGFVELRDAEEQRRRFRDAAERIRHAGRTPPPIPERYLSCLPWLPPTVGMALGMDRLVMLMAGCDGLRDVLPFAFGDA
jgi:lysyl-tRNA synthetase class 2